MDKSIPLLIFIASLFAYFPRVFTVRAATNCNYTITSGTATADGANNFSSVRPGDTVCLSAGSRGALKLQNFHGTATSPIIFINNGGNILINNSGYAGIEIFNSQHIHITGTGTNFQCGSPYSESTQDCGIKIDSTAAGTAGRGIAGESKTEYIEIDHVEIGSTGESGITIKTKDYNRTQFNQHDTYLHHNYVHDTTIDEGTEGMYIGSSDYSAGVDPTLIGVDISYNLVARTGWDGIQVGSAIENCKIHHNTIINDSLKLVDFQKSGIMNNRGSVCDIYNNLISEGYADYGIYVQGNGGNKIYNNIITNRTVNSGSGIKISTGSNTQNSIYVWNNSVVNMADKGISFSNSAGNDNQVLNNIIVRASGTSLSPGIARSSNNLISASADTVKFVDFSGNNFMLQSSSPAVNGGTQVPIETDYLDNLRPIGGLFDIGAYEYGLPASVTPTPTQTPPTPTATAGKPGDANGDNRVDGIDYVIWLNHYGLSVSGVSNGDFNNSGRVDGVDYVIWLNNYGS